MVERWTLPFDFGGQEMAPAPHGEFVRFSDYEALRARLETVEAETRERCAKVATDQAYMFIGGPARTVYGQGYQKGCELVAETIRNLEPRHD